MCNSVNMVYSQDIFEPKPPKFGKMIMDFLNLEGDGNIDWTAQIGMV